LSVMTPSRLKLLRLIQEISSKNQFGIAPVREIIRMLKKEKRIRGASVRKYTTELKQMGFIDNPLWGGWRLTNKGKIFLKELK